MAVSELEIVEKLFGMLGNQMQTTPKLRRGAATAKVVLLASAFTIVGGYAAYKIIFQRTGEAATALIPADASMVVTFDTSPSERQVLTFKKIDDELEAQGMKRQFDSMVDGMLAKKGLGEEIRRSVSTSFAMASWLKENQEPSMVLLVALKDTGSVQKQLATVGKPDASGTILLEDSKTSFKIIGNYLAVSSDPALIKRVEDTQSGSIASVSNDKNYKEARSALPEDANTMFFIRSEAYAQMSKMGNPNLKLDNFDKNGFMSFSLTVTGEGLEIDSYSPMVGVNGMDMSAYNSIPAVDMAALGKLPGNALGVASLPSVSTYIRSFKKAMGSVDASVESQMNEGITEFEKESGFNLENDILPAFDGEFTLMVYPGAKPEDTNFAIHLSDANGAKAGQLAEKLLAKAEAEAKKDPKAPKTLAVKSQIGEYEAWSAAPELRSEVLKETPELKSHDLIVLRKGEDIFVCTSKELAEQLAGVSAPKFTLSQDPAMKPIFDGSNQKIVMMINLRRFMNMMRPLLEDQMKNSPVTVADIQDLLGPDTKAITMEATWDSEHSTSHCLVPLDFVKLIQIIGKSQNQASIPSADRSGETVPYERGGMIETR